MLVNLLKTILNSFIHLLFASVLNESVTSSSVRVFFYGKDRVRFGKFAVEPRKTMVSLYFLFDAFGILQIICIGDVAYKPI